jgi:hypothetical protein
MQKLKIYTYTGPVYVWDSLYEKKWNGSTQAANAARAISNLKYRYKLENNMITSTKVELLNSNLTVEEDEDE